MPATDEPTRPARQCTICLLVDDHPRHTWAPELSAGGQVTQVSAHMDCCAAQGCPDHSCDAILASAGIKRGQALTAHLVSGGADEALAAWRGQRAQLAAGST
jgi:hypothetical protein